MVNLPALLWALTFAIALARRSLSWRSHFEGSRVISTVVGRFPVPRRHVFRWGLQFVSSPPGLCVASTIGGMRQTGVHCRRMRKTLQHLLSTATREGRKVGSDVARRWWW
jgi:hypothetical protein